MSTTYRVCDSCGRTLRLSYEGTFPRHASSVYEDDEGYEYEALNGPECKNSGLFALDPPGGSIRATSGGLPTLGRDRG